MPRFYLFLLGASVITALSTTSCQTPKGIETTPETWSFEMKKGGCLDVCKSYTISIESNGHYTYKGYFNVKYLGERSGEISTTNLKKLSDQLTGLDWESFQATYGVQSNDSPRKQVSYTSELKNKTIVYFRLEPQAIRELETSIDQLIDADEF